MVKIRKKFDSGKETRTTSHAVFEALKSVDTNEVHEALGMPEDEVKNNIELAKNVVRRNKGTLTLAECNRGYCPINRNGYCFAYRAVCSDKDVFKCKQCGYELMKKNPLNTSKCPNCGTTVWDIEPIHCFNCGYEWVPRGNPSPDRCPSCRKRI